MYSNTPAAEYVSAGNAYSAMLCRAESEWEEATNARAAEFDKTIEEGSFISDFGVGCQDDSESAMHAVMMLALESLLHGQDNSQAIQRTLVAMLKEMRTSYAENH